MKRETAEKKKRETYQLIDATRERICGGCGRSDKPLTHSHLINQRRMREVLKRPELIAEPELIAFHCHECHVQWENGNPNLLDFQLNLKIVEKYDPDKAREIKGLNELKNW